MAVRTQTCGSVPAAQSFDSYFMTLCIFPLLCSTLNPTGTFFFCHTFWRRRKEKKKPICIHAGRGINNICCRGRPLFTLDVLVREQDQSRGPLGRFRGLLLLTRWLSVSCSVLTGHIYFFLVHLFLVFFFFFLPWAMCWVLLPLPHVTQWPVC